MAIENRGERFSKHNQPKRTPNHPTKSHAVLANEGFETASAEALSSRWATQVGKRAGRIAERIRTGTY